MGSKSGKASLCGAVKLRKIAKTILKFGQIDFAARVNDEDDYRDFQVDESGNKFENTISINAI